MKKFLLALFFLFPAVCLAQNLKEQLFFDNSVSVLIPENFTPADENSIISRFPDEANRPKVVLTDEEGLALISLNIAENTGDRQTIIHFFRDVKDSLRKTYPEHRIITSDVIRNRTLAYIEVLLPNEEGKMLYNMMGFRYVDKKFFSFNFSCPEDIMKKYQDTVREMVKDIKVIRRG